MKTEDRSDTEIVISIIEPLQKILDEIAVEPIKGSLVFPQIYAGEQNPEGMKARVSQENQNIRKRLGRLVKTMGWDVAPSGTWCRHSFATNLSHAGGVPKEYKQEAMGHSVMSGTVTDRYIQTYPLARQMEFNSKLLKVGNQVDIMGELQGLTPDHIQALIEMVKKNKS